MPGHTPAPSTHLQSAARAQLHPQLSGTCLQRCKSGEKTEKGFCVPKLPAERYQRQAVDMLLVSERQLEPATKADPTKSYMAPGPAVGLKSRKPARPARVSAVFVQAQQA